MGGGVKPWGGVDPGGRWESFLAARELGDMNVSLDAARLRASLVAMASSDSQADRLAAKFLWLLPHNRFHVRLAWWKLLGQPSDGELFGAAEIYAYGALKRWWPWYSGSRD